MNRKHHHIVVNLTYEMQCLQNKYNTLLHEYCCYKNEHPTREHGDTETRELSSHVIQHHYPHPSHYPYHYPHHYPHHHHPYPHPHPPYNYHHYPNHRMLNHDKYLDISGNYYTIDSSGVHHIIYPAYPHPGNLYPPIIPVTTNPPYNFNKPPIKSKEITALPETDEWSSSPEDNDVTNDVTNELTSTNQPPLQKESDRHFYSIPHSHFYYNPRGYPYPYSYGYPYTYPNPYPNPNPYPYDYDHLYDGDYV